MTGTPRVMCERCGERPAQGRVFTISAGSVDVRQLCAPCRDAEVERTGPDGSALLRDLLLEQRADDA